MYEYKLRKNFHKYLGPLNEQSRMNRVLSDLKIHDVLKRHISQVVHPKWQFQGPGIIFAIKFLEIIAEISNIKYFSNSLKIEVGTVFE